MRAIAIATAFAAALSVGAPAFADKGGSCHSHGSAPAKEETVLTCTA